MVCNKIDMDLHASAMAQWTPTVSRLFNFLVE